jgi:hypothetical protein
MARAGNPPGGFAIKTGSQSLTTSQKRQVARNVQKPIRVYTADGAIDVESQVAVLSKTSAAAMTLAAPTVGTDDGTEIIITAGTAFAHVVTATGLIQDGVTGGAKNTYTTVAFLGCSATFRAYNGFWHLISKNLGATA